MGIGRSAALELLLEALPEGSPGDQVRLYFGSNGDEVKSPGVHHDNPKFDMVAPGKETAVQFGASEGDGEPIDEHTEFATDLGLKSDGGLVPVAEPESEIPKSKKKR